MTEKTNTIKANKRARISDGARADRQALFREILFGITYLGIAFLLGRCELLFSTLPLGLALLCASSAHSWYILAGLLLSAVTLGGERPLWIAITVYSLCILLRIGALYLVDTGNDEKGKNSSADRRDKLSVKRDVRYLHRCWDSFKDMFSSKEKRFERDEIREDYYPGSMFAKDPPAPREDDGTDKDEGRPLLFCENIFLRMLSGVICAFAWGFADMVRGGFQFYDLFGTLFLLLVTPLTIFLFSPTFSREGERLLFILKSPPHSKEGSVKFTAFSTVSAALLLFVTLYAARGYEIGLGIPLLTVYLSPLLALLLTLLFSERLGFIAGIVSAVLAGLAAGPMLTPILILASAIFTLLSPLSRRASAIGAVSSALVFTYFYGGVEQLIYLFPSILLSMPLFLACEKISEYLPAAEPTVEEMNDFTAAVTYEIRAAANKARIESLSAALTSLSCLFYSLSDRLKKPRSADVEEICERAFAKKCKGCPRKNSCELAARFKEQIPRMLDARGGIDTDALAPEIREDCPHAAEISEEISREYADISRSLYRSEKTEVCADDYSAISTLLEDMMRADAHELSINREAADRIYDYLSELGINVRGVAVCGKRICHVTVRGARFERVAQKADEIRAELEKICGTRLSPPTFERDGDVMLMRTSSIPSIDTVYSGSTVCATGGERSVLYRPLTNEFESKQTYVPPAECGDHIAIFKANAASDRDGYFYAIISDGMGSGEAAAFTSGICTVFLEKMLCAGSSTDTALRMLNGIIRTKNDSLGDECSATVDLLELDLISGHAVFAKNGAAPTYVVRGGTVYKLCSRTVPIGILKDTVPQLLKFRMRPGDVIVMVSDGVTLGNDECPWLIDLLSDTLPTSMDSLRLDILRRAIAAGSDDDLSAIAVRVDEAKEE